MDTLPKRDRLAGFRRDGTPVLVRRNRVRGVKDDGGVDLSGCIVILPQGGGLTVEAMRLVVGSRMALITPPAPEAGWPRRVRSFATAVRYLSRAFFARGGLEGP